MGQRLDQGAARRGRRWADLIRRVIRLAEDTLPKQSWRISRGRAGSSAVVIIATASWRIGLDGCVRRFVEGVPDEGFLARLDEQFPAPAEVGHDLDEGEGPSF